MTKLESHLKGIVNVIAGMGYEFPLGEPFLFTKELDSLYKYTRDIQIYIEEIQKSPQKEQAPPHQPRPVPPQTEPFDSPQRRIIVWSEDLKKEYNVYGLVDPGEKVEVSKEPVKQNGRIVNKGDVQSLD